MSTLSHARLLELLHYDPTTGLFTRKIRTANRTRVGEIAGSINTEGYRYMKLDSQCFKANRLAWFYVHGAWPSGQVDHINGDRSDDRIANLRDCSCAENSQNRHQPKGAYRCGKKGRFTSYVTVSGKRHYLGRFSTEHEAREAYASAKSRLHPFQDQRNLCR